MGSKPTKAANSKVSRKDRRNAETYRHGLLRAVERFVVNVYASCSRVDSMKLILEIDFASKAFGSFVTSEHADEIYYLYKTTHDMTIGRPTNYRISTAYEKLMSKYISAGSPSQVMLSRELVDLCVHFLAFDVDSHEYQATFRDVAEKIKDETLCLMARDQFNRFLSSRYYKAWRSTEASHAIATTVEDRSVVMGGVASSKSVFGAMRGSVRSINLSTTPSAKKRRKDADLSVRAFTNLDAVEMKRILGGESWMAALLAAVEGLPIAFSIASARQAKGFPLMFVNKYFEEMTGYNRKDVIGLNCRFLQCPFTEESAILQMKEALHKGQGTCVVLTNKTEDGNIFRNLVCLKPVYDDKERYCYVMALHIDVSREIDGYESKTKLACDLMDMLPDVIITDEEESYCGCCCFGKK